MGVTLVHDLWALIFITIPIQPYPHSLLQRPRKLKSPPLRSSSAGTWGPTEFARSTASEKSSARLECLRLPKVGKGHAAKSFGFHLFFTKQKHRHIFLCVASISETHTPQRKGLRSSALRPKKQEPAKQTGPVVIETWVPEEELDLWEIRAFSERSDGPGHVKICQISQKDLLTCRMRLSFHRVEKEKAQAAEQAKVIVVHLKYL